LKAALIVIDGMADRTQEALGGRTPLQAASLPNLDGLAGAGACGHMYPVAPGVCAGSDQALWQILGYGDHRYPGRASIEAAGAGAPLEAGDVVFRVNLATTMVDEGRRYAQVAPAFLPEDQAVEIGGSLAGYRAEHFAARLQHLGGPFMALVLSGGASALVSDSDPVFYRLPLPGIVPLAGGGGSAEKTARELERFTSWAADVLAAHPVNAARESEGIPAINHVLVKWPSTVGGFPSFYEAWGFRAAAVASGVFYEGLARSLGMEFHGLVRPDAGEDLHEKLLDAREALDHGFDFVFIHTKAADEASHRGKPSRKVAVLQELDLALTLAGQAFARDPELLTVITCDHATPSSGTDEVLHSGESVPVLMLGRNVRVDAVSRFDEVSCAAGSLGQLGGRDIMPLVLNFTNRARFATTRIGAAARPYRPFE
jgi:2,3-bisphosphoglycerate-independent phosphoglycerate mutase